MKSLKTNGLENYFENAEQTVNHNFDACWTKIINICMWIKRLS